MCIATNYKLDLESGDAIINVHCCQAVSLLVLHLEELFYFCLLQNY